MKELVKTSSEWFSEYYTGTNGDRYVICVLDKNCVRYIVKVNGKIRARKEYDNANKDLCFQMATKALNR